MSTDYYLICRVHKEKTESFVASASGFYGEKLWADDDVRKMMKEFLFKHENCHIAFVSEHSLEHEGLDE